MVNLFEYRADSNFDHPNPAYSARPWEFYGQAPARVGSFLLRALPVKDSHMIEEMTKCDKVVSTISAELLYGPPMISHVIPKVFENMYTKCTYYWSNNYTVRGFQVIEYIAKCGKLENTNIAKL